jgi:ATP-dependent Lon protease
MAGMKGLRDEVVFDFDADTSANEKKGGPDAPVCTYTLFDSVSAEADAEHPILVLEDPHGELAHHLNGAFYNPHRRTAFEYDLTDDVARADILRLDRRFVHLLEWLGENHVPVRLSGAHTAGGYAVYRIRALDPTGQTNIPTAVNGFLQLVIERLLESRLPENETEDEDREEDEQERLHITDMYAMVDFLKCAGSTLPANIRSWAKRNIAQAKSTSISPEERLHAQRALATVLNIRWQSTYFESIDPVRARRILDEELYGMERVKQRVIETIIQINRTHKLPAYGLLLAGPAGVGKSQIAYAVARILHFPWTSLDMSAIHDAEQLTGSPRIYSNAKPGRIMEAFSQAGSSNLVFIINELDKADSQGNGGNPADALLTLLDNLGYTDNYIECMIPTGGVYPIATANDKSRISAPLMSRFAVIDIPDYTPDEKKVIFKRFSLPKVLKRLGMEESEITVKDEAVDVIVERFAGETGVRDLEQAAEHLCANALFRIETTGVDHVTYDREAAEELLG